MDKGTALGIVRHILTAAGGVLVTKGVIDDVGLTQAVGGLIALLGVAWSMYDKKQKKLA